MGPDQSTLEEALQVLRDYDLTDKMPKSIVDYLTHCGPEGETPKAFPENTYFLLNTIPDSCLYAKEICGQMGIPSIILTNFLEGESRDVGGVFGSIARNIQTYGEPIKPPCVILSAGEVTTKISDNDSILGHGGPSHELTAGFAIAAAKVPGACMLSIDTEGTDGTTLAAGGLTDSQTLRAAKEKGIDLYEALRGHATHEALAAMGDAVFTGNTGTNLCDLNIMYVPALD